MNNTSKNYYETLQISPNASQEIIEKAYKTLAKKYHPDMQQNANKQVAEDLMKELNEAYETLSNPQKKEIYDQNLKKHEISEEQFQNLYNENKNLKNELNYLKNKNNNNINNNINNNSNNYSNFQNNLNYQNTNTQQNVQNLNDYYSSYIKNLKKRGYKIKYKKTFRQHLESFISVIITIIIIFIIFQIPFIKNLFINLYNENNAFKFIIDLITGFFSAFFNLFKFNK